MKKGTSIDSFPLGPPSTSCGKSCFEWLISPQDCDSFTSHFWEKKPLIIKRKKLDYFSGLISRRTIENYVKSDSGFAVGSLILNKGTAENKEIVAETQIDSETFSRMLDDEGWKCQVVHPQQRNAKLHALLERLENWSGTVWGSNMYFGSTGSDENGFEAFSDNVELFVLQLDGQCHWKIFEGEQKLSRDSGSEYTEDELGPSVLDEILEAGDILYIPRGFIHSCQPTSKYAYLTLSTYQNQSWCDFLSTSITEAIDSVTRANVEFREGLPINWISFFGRAIEETDANVSQRGAFKSKLSALLQSIVDAIDIDDIADQMASDFIALRTPPVVRKRPNSTDENEGRIFGPDPRKNNDLKIRIRNPAWMRIVIDDAEDEEGKILIFSALDNDVSLHMKTDNPLDAEPTSIEIVGTKSLPGLRELVKTWPEWCPLDIISRDIAGELWEHGLIESAATEDSKKPRIA